LDAIGLSSSASLARLPHWEVSTPWISTSDLQFNQFASPAVARMPIHGIISSGTAPSIIPDHTVGRFYLRAKQRTYLDELKQKFLACVEGAATSTGTTFTTREYEFSFDDMQNNLVLAERMRDYLCEVLGVLKVERAPEFFGRRHG
jgi:metal-dependent amidase/aminoacylase/carboxypeptidase family protein